jgi:hypothetical protein
MLRSDHLDCWSWNLQTGRQLLRSWSLPAPLQRAQRREPVGRIGWRRTHSPLQRGSKNLAVRGPFAGSPCFGHLLRSVLLRACSQPGCYIQPCPPDKQSRQIEQALGISFGSPIRFWAVRNRIASPVAAGATICQAVAQSIKQTKANGPYRYYLPLGDCVLAHPVLPPPEGQRLSVGARF